MATPKGKGKGEDMSKGKGKGKDKSKSKSKDLGTAGEYDDFLAAAIADSRRLGHQQRPAVLCCNCCAIL